jgi:hypothetical protein
MLSAANAGAVNSANTASAAESERMPHPITSFINLLATD